MTNIITITAAQGDPFILVTGHGLWSADYFEQHFRALDRELRAMRVRNGFARVLVDLSGSLVQTTEAAAVMNHWTARIYRPKDEVAVICGTTLLTMQVRREARIYERRIFTEKAPAMAWLLSDKKSGAAAARSA